MPSTSDLYDVIDKLKAENEALKHRLDPPDNGNHWPRQADFSAFFTEGFAWTRKNGWRSLSIETRIEKKFYPNQVYVNSAVRQVLIPLYVKGDPVNAATLGEPLIYYALDRVHRTHRGNLKPGEPPIDQVWVALAYKEGSRYIKTTTIGQIERAIRGVMSNMSNDPSLPRYFWINAEAEASTREDFMKRIRGDGDDCGF